MVSVLSNHELICTNLKEKAAVHCWTWPWGLFGNGCSDRMVPRFRVVGRKVGNEPPFSISLNVLFFIFKIWCSLLWFWVPVSLQNLILNIYCFHIFETWLLFFFFLNVLEVFYIKACHYLPSYSVVHIIFFIYFGTYWPEIKIEALSLFVDFFFFFFWFRCAMRFSSNKFFGCCFFFFFLQHAFLILWVSTSNFTLTFS